MLKLRGALGEREVATPERWSTAVGATARAAGGRAATSP